MACFVVPMAEAIVVSVVKHMVAKKEEQALLEASTPRAGENSYVMKEKTISQTGLSWTRKLTWLNALLWGGVILLAVEHIWYGEVILWPPFLTAMRNPMDIPIMLHEMATIGTSMAIFVTLVWGSMVFVVEQRMKHSLRKGFNRN
ncbi:hypothetical protein CLNEO_21300 [Anaerotignum neopropionicum]|uniref:Uncharacterized protein n=1 Tax=Anaerotignum neopropionicum TaxID=36847 RepID=A0A136WD72_9FIRM|nr:hypothetical protein [Anaerotignum neopropionicum]KXL52434.1 hypothetical protein CLNEO_21300 [Anaerotignum neopropionicum]